MTSVENSRGFFLNHYFDVEDFFHLHSSLWIFNKASFVNVFLCSRSSIVVAYVNAFCETASPKIEKGFDN